MSGGGRILPFLGASLAVHVIAIGAFGTDPLNVALSSRGAGHEISVRLEAAAPTTSVTDAQEKSAESPSSESLYDDGATDTQSGSASERTAPAQSTGKGSRKAAQESGAPERADPEVATGSGNATEAPDATDELREIAKDSDPRAHHAERVAVAEDPATGSASVTSKATRNDAREALVAEVAKYFHYPSIAQRRGWEGTVVLSVRILPDGRLDNIRVVRSSGRALLDRSAAGSLAHVQRLPEIADRVGRTGIALRIPVTYRLESA